MEMYLWSSACMYYLDTLFCYGVLTVFDLYAQTLNISDYITKREIRYKMTSINITFSSLIL